MPNDYRSWDDILKSVPDQVDGKWYNTDPSDEPNSHFITRDQLDDIWCRSPISSSDRRTPFEIFSSVFNTNIEPDEFKKKLICLISALVYVGWNARTFQGRPCGLTSEGLSVPGAASISITDADLPLPVEVIKSLLGNSAWKFRINQFAFSPAVITKGLQKAQWCPEGTRLPFEPVRGDELSPISSTGVRSGWYGDVKPVRIIKGYYLKSEGKEALSEEGEIIACKTLKASQTAYAEEHDALVVIGGNTKAHAHITTHLAAIVIENMAFKLLFPWAWTDLNDFLGRPSSDYPSWISSEAVKPVNLLKEMEHIADALAFLHEELKDHSGRRISLFHMDLKPDNILVFEPDNSEQLEKYPLGVWKISDFGLSELGQHAINRQPVITPGDMVYSARSPDSTPTRMVGPYQAPEAEQKDQQAVDQAKADVWSYGCVFAEVFAFACRGPTGVQESRSRRNRNNLDPDGKARYTYFYAANESGDYELVPRFRQYFDTIVNAENAHERQHGWKREIWLILTKFMLHIDPTIRRSAKWHSDNLYDIREQYYWDNLSTFNHCVSPHNTSSLQDGLFDSKDVSALPDTSIGPGSSSSSVRRSSASTSHTHDSRRQQPMGSETVGDRVRNLSLTKTPSISTGRSYSPASANIQYRGTGSVASSGHASSLDPPRSDSTSSNHNPSRQATFDGPASQPSRLSTLSPTATVQSQDSLSDGLKELKIKPSFVVIATDESHVLFSDKSAVACCQILLDGSFGSLVKVPRGVDTALDSNSVRMAGNTLMIKDSNVTTSVYKLEEEYFVLQKGQNSFDGQQIGRFDVASSGYFALELMSQIKIFNQDMTFVASCDTDKLLDLRFELSGHILFAVSEIRYYVCELDDSTGAWSVLKCGEHGLRQTKDALRLRIVPIQATACFMVQNLDHLTQIDLFGHFAISRLDILPSKFKISGPLFNVTGDMRTLCIVSRRRKWTTEHHVQSWTLDSGTLKNLDSTDPPRIPKQLASSASFKPHRVELMALWRDGQNFARLFDASGGSFEVPLPAYPYIP